MIKSYTETPQTESLQEDVFKLFQISLSIGKSLDPKKNAEEFLKTLMSLKNLTFGAIWIKKKLYFENESEQGGYGLLYANPFFNVKDKTKELNNPVIKLLEISNAVTLSSEEKEFKAYFDNRKLEGGNLCFIRLEDVGWIELHAHSNTLNNKEISMLKPVIRKFNQTILASLANEKTIKTQKLLQKIEREKQVTQQRLIAQLTENEHLQKNITKRLEYQVAERTEELTYRNFELKQQQEEILAMNDQLAQQKEELESTFNQLEKKSEELALSNKMMTDSIRYAKTIQASVFPTHEEWLTTFSEYFVLYKPKDIVSGDFYWLTHINNFTFLSVLDCTGHGVPGALMSMIGNTLLHEIIKQNKVLEPADILENLDKGIREALNQHKSNNTDGMELSICRFEKVNNTQFNMTFAGAKRPVYLMQKGTFHTLKPTKRAVGGCASRKIDFMQTEILLNKGDLLYLLTDGFQDQANKERNRFKSTSLIDVIKRVNEQDLDRQKDVFERILAKHQGRVDQRDDITLVGVRL